MAKLALDDFSQKAAEKLFSRYPQWRGLETPESAKDGSIYLRLTVPALPEAHVEHGLMISTENRELTIGFDAYHSHFFDAVGDGTHFGIEYGMQFLSKLLAEKIAVISWWEDERWRASGQIKAGEEPDSSAAHLNPFNRIRIRSWKGTFNADIKV